MQIICFIDLFSFFHSVYKKEEDGTISRFPDVYTTTELPAALARYAETAPIVLFGQKDFISGLKQEILEINPRAEITEG